MLTKIFLIFCCLCSYAFSDTYYFFKPPKGWKVANPDLLSESVEVGFIGKSTFKFKPSINLATEKVSLSLENYMKEVKKIYQNDRTTSYRDLGSLPTKAGQSRLLEITKKTKFGQVKMLQAILVKNNKAYVLTGAMESKGFIEMYNIFIKAFQSFTFTENLLSVIQNDEKKEKLEKTISSFQAQENKKDKQKQFNKLQKMITKNFNELGTHWQIAILRDIQTVK